LTVAISDPTPRTDERRSLALLGLGALAGAGLIV